jgi:hypothetical protein
LEETDTLVDYFSIIGLEEKKVAAIIEQSSKNGIGSGYDVLEELQKLVPTMISQFPKKSKKCFPLDNDVIAEMPNVRNYFVHY